MKHRSSRRSADDVLDEFRKATSTTSRPSKSDEVIAMISSSVIDRDYLDEIVPALIEDACGSWSLAEFSERTGATPITSLIYNSAFIRAAARRGFVFYIGPDLRIYRYTVKKQTT